MNVNTFQAGETVGLWAYIKDWAGTYTSPDNGVTVTLTNPSGTVKVNAQAMAESETGKFVYYYKSVADDVKGWWRYTCISQDGTGDDARYVITKGSFELK